jgi:type IV pilus assembly protein PilN
LIEISGRASTFNDVNDFLLLLQRSPFVDPKETRLISSEKRPDQDLQSLGLDKVPQAALPSALKPKIPGSVDYKIQVGLTKASSAELIGELERKGAVGLVTRIEQLKEKGVLPR